MAIDFLEFPKGTPMFEREGKNLRGTSWDVFAMFVCGHHPRCSVEELREGGPHSASEEAESSNEGGEGGSEGPPPPVVCGGGVVDPLLGGPHSEARFELAKRKMWLP